MNKFEAEVKEKGQLPALSFPGGYPIYYVTILDAVLCAQCASKEAERIGEHECHMEGSSLTCVNCMAEIESAYGDPENEKEVK